MCAYLCSYVWKGRKQLGVWALEEGDCAYPRVWLCSTKPYVSCEYMCVCYTMLISLSLLSLFSCALVCLRTLIHVLYFCAHSLPTVPIDPHTFMYARNWMKLSTFCAFIPSKDWGHLLAIDTAGDAIWGHHTPPVPSPSKQGSSHHLVSMPMTGDKESSTITQSNV